jgi:hypothetical protein
MYSWSPLDKRFPPAHASSGTCAPENFEYIRTTLQFSTTAFVQWLKPLTGGLLVALVLLLDAMAASPELHELIHADAGKADHQCAVTLFAHGQVECAAVDVAAILPPASAPLLFFLPLPVFTAAVETLPPGRAPPGLPAVS